MTRRGIWTLDELAGLLRGLALACDLSEAERRGFGRCLVAVCVALGLPVGEVVGYADIQGIRGIGSSDTGKRNAGRGI